MYEIYNFIVAAVLYLANVLRHHTATAYCVEVEWDAAEVEVPIIPVSFPRKN